MKKMTNRDYIMNISVKDFINEYCLPVGYTEKDFVRLMILFKADDDRVNEWLDSEMIGGRKLTNAERIKSMNVEALAEELDILITEFGGAVPCAACAGEKDITGNYCCADFSYDCRQGVVKWLESEVRTDERKNIAV